MLQQALPPLSPDATSRLAEYDRLLAAALPLAAKHRRELPWSIKRLSAILTGERADGFAPKYMSEAEGLAAYGHYFLPWNLYRLGRLFSGLRLEVPDGATVLDLGSGPLTAVQALWLARPELRTKALHIHCLDRAGASLRLGRQLFEALAGESPWRINLIQGGLTSRVPVRADLLLAANVLNEFQLRAEDGGAERLARSLLRDLAPGGRMVLVEPGTRSGGRLLSSLREELLAEGLVPQGPCPHLEQCPMPGTAGRPWCHFGFGLLGAPHWLANLSEEAGLPKSRATLSYLYMTDGQPLPAEGLVRVVSEPMSLPQGVGRYGCSGRGLVLLTGSPERLRDLPSGSLLAPPWPEHPAQDFKSGALILPLETERPLAPASLPKAPAPKAPVARPKGPKNMGQPAAAQAPRAGQGPSGPKRAGKPGGKAGVRGSRKPGRGDA